MCYILQRIYNGEVDQKKIITWDLGKQIVRLKALSLEMNTVIFGFVATWLFDFRGAEKYMMQIQLTQLIFL